MTTSARFHKLNAHLSALRQVDYLKELPDSELRKIAVHGREVTFGENQEIYEEGDISDALYVLLAGALQEKSEFYGDQASYTMDSDVRVFGEHGAVLQIHADDSKTAVKVPVGPSKQKTKTVTLPTPANGNIKTYDGWIVGDKPMNDQEEGCKDTFSVIVNGNQLTVTRTNLMIGGSGWQQELCLKGKPPPAWLKDRTTRRETLRATSDNTRSVCRPILQAVEEHVRPDVTDPT